MAIGRAEKRGNLVFVHDDEGQLRFVRIGDLRAHTPTLVSIERGGLVSTFDESGREVEQARLIGNDTAVPRLVLRRAVGAR